MKELNGYIMLHRKILDWGWYKEPVTCSVFIHLLLKASYKDTTFKGVELKSGQLITGRKKLSKETGFSEKQIRTALEHLKNTGEVAIKTASKFSVITIVNWGKYQIFTDEEANKTANKGPTEGQQGASKGPHINKYNKLNNLNKFNNNMQSVNYDMEEFERRAAELPVYHSRRKADDL